MTLLYRERSVTFNRFKQLLGLTDGALYTHARKLVDAGYIKTARHLEGDRTQTLYMLTPSGRRIFIRYLEFLERIVTKGERNDETQ